MTDADSTDVVRGTRFSGGPARAFLSSLAEDERIFEADLAVDRAHVVMLAEQDIITESDAGVILDALDGIETSGFDALPSGEDVHAAIETAVVEAAGEAGRRMHTARSRNDEVATCIRYRLCADLLDVLAEVLALRQVLVSDAADHLETVMPGYTHLQPAQPTTVAHWLVSYESGASRDTERLLDAYDRVDRSPLGSVAFAGTPFPIDRERTAELLGFDAIIENAMDAVSTRDFMAEVGTAMVSLATTLSGLSTDMIHFSSRGYVLLDSDYASTSSVMPQKRNPDSLELVRATTGDAVGALNAILTTTKGLPRAYNRDLQRATPHIWSALDAVGDAAAVLTGAIETATWAPDAMEEAATQGFATATGVADHLAMNGVPFRTAHEVVAQAGERGGDIAAIEAAIEEVLGESLGAVADRSVVESILEGLPNVEMRDSVGGPAPSSVESSIDDATGELRDHRGTVSSIRDDRRDAGETLAQAVSQYQ
jgi:argininosuccinate lyase